MDFNLNAEQSVLVSAVQSICQPYKELAVTNRESFYYFAEKLQLELATQGFLDPIRAGLTDLDAALVLYETSSLPAVVEVGASVLVAPHLTENVIEGPIALLSGDLTKPQRMLSIAKSAIIDTGGDVVVLKVDQSQIEPVESIFAYPYGRYIAKPDLSEGYNLGPAALNTLKHWHRLSIAIECAAAAEAATNFTVEYVKQRHVFQKPIGSFQAVQHRLAQCHIIARGLRLAALYAAWSGTQEDADQAATYAQQHIHKFVFDLHQFNGAMGLTNEYLLHFWTYRLRALQAEAGGMNGAALAIADARWPIKAVS